MTAKLFSRDGSTVDVMMAGLNSYSDEVGCYMLCIDDDENLFLLLNELYDLYELNCDKIDELPPNASIAKYIPNITLRGDIVLAKTDGGDDERLISVDPSVLLKYKFTLTNSGLQAEKIEDSHGNDAER